MGKKKKKDYSPLKYLVLTLREVEKLLAAGAKAEKRAICSAAIHLTNYVCIHPVDLPGAARVCGAKGIKYETWDYESYSEVLHRDAANYYHAMFETTCGYYDENLDCGLLQAGGQVEVAKKWKKVLRALRDAVPTTFKPGEMLRVAKLAQAEQKAARKLAPPPPPAAYDPTDADGWSKELAQAQLKQLASYRDGKKAKSRKVILADDLTFYEGEPNDRFVTKIGGLPYRPASLPWPARGDGKPMSFFAQVCFADSEDLVSAFDEVLVIFAAEEESYSGSPNAVEPDLRFEWYPLGIANLVTAKDVPATAWNLLPCYARVERLPEEDGPIEGPKIGGNQFVIQHAHKPEEDEFLAALGQVRLSETPKQTKAGFRYLRMADDGLLNLFRQINDHLTWDLQSY